MTKRLITLFAFCSVMVFGGGSVKGQDPHGSPFVRPEGMYYHPGLVGANPNEINLQGYHRRQWGSLNDPFITSMFSVDGRLEQLGLGLSVYDSGIGGGGMKHTQLSVGFAFHAPIRPSHRLSLGFQGGFVQKRFDPARLSFDNQYNPDFGFDPNLPNGEIFESTSITRGDLHAGFNWRYQAQTDAVLRGFMVGASFGHLTQPSFSFLGGDGELPMRMALSGSMDLGLGERTTISPELWYLEQGTANEVNLSAILGYEVDSMLTLRGGAMYRWDDAVGLFLGIEYGQLDVRFGYDITTSSLSSFNSGQGGPEVGLRYRIPTRRTVKPSTQSYPSAKLRPNDRDQDGIVDSKDACPDIPGIKPFQGCPDSDGDGIRDEEDLCPSIPGLASMQGCPPNDRDGDGILDNADLCPSDPGLIAFRGCPDFDGDDLPDHLDKCPTQPGPRYRAGCPHSDIDADGDGIPDKIDLCPQHPGVPELQGCPDQDGDGISDYEDLCPTIAGTRLSQGCPEGAVDSDKDGVMDRLDECPTVAGVVSLAGCPDADMDGVSDFEDQCPNTPGPKEHRGCPIGQQRNMDADGDGVLNHIDECPYVPGIKALFGCPDSDKDGISDLVDNCPLRYGPESNGGCPTQANMGIRSKMDGEPVFGVVEFDTDQAIIKPKYFQMLDELAEYLVSNPEHSIQIAGHTDNEGTPMYNMVLGQNRAVAIIQYLTAKGVSKSRMATISYGENLPKANNGSSNGRARNRRSELILNAP
ncbi:PorP/SprF family type IX secretion system membrane protein [Pontibacter sp. G13]|uniref:PorP/SprF family type IX secretion system membrane protein n=1 Tax=Pontibacter sp. G13 TaxID=3074898 RepID=UPI00288A72E4|nr:PorP/SprF family type IX secretion system membrane protein [Pontibacter sp. G13]WNJ18922.1 PorP/SprF family type IX secretion system membrane protein [Pontibacter sp. G13]